MWKAKAKEGVSNSINKVLKNLYVMVKCTKKALNFLSELKLNPEIYTMVTNCYWFYTEDYDDSVQAYEKSINIILLKIVLYKLII